MASCDICRKKLGFAGGKELYNTVGNVKIGIPIIVCEDCYITMRKLKVGDPDAYKEIHEKIDEKGNIPLIKFIKQWEIGSISDASKDTIRKGIEKDEKERELQKQISELRETIMTTTGYKFQGWTIEKYIGVRSKEAVIGTGFLSELSSEINDIMGTESDRFSQKIESARKLVMDRLLEVCIREGANGIIGISFSYFTLRNNSICVSGTGTIVRVSQNSNLVKTQ